MSRLVIALALLVSGCSGCTGYPNAFFQEEATELVWHGVYSQSAWSQPPQIEWIEPEDLDCGLGEDGVYRGFYRRIVPIERAIGITSQCVAGVFWSDTYTAQVAHPKDFTFPTSSFAHELCHADVWRKTGSGDPTHMGICFTTNGLVDSANQVLKDAGIE